jgi:hypothetical protein
MRFFVHFSACYMLACSGQAQPEPTSKTDAPTATPQSVPEPDEPCLANNTCADPLTQCATYKGEGPNPVSGKACVRSAEAVCARLNCPNNKGCFMMEYSPGIILCEK